MEVSQQVGSGVRNNESRTTIKISPKQKIDKDRRCERSLGVNPLGSHGNAFVEWRLRSILSGVSGPALAEWNYSSHSGQIEELPKFGPPHTVHDCLAGSGSI